MIFKIIVAGRLEFGKKKTFDKVLEMYQFRVDNFYKFDLLFREEVFDHENFMLNIPRLVAHKDHKSWKNTVKLLEYLAEYSVAGTVRLWKIGEDGAKKRIEHELIEPKTDKVAVQSFIKGKALIDQDGMENEAMAALNKAIEKYERHSLAYERRGLINFKFKNYKDALYDFTKSIDLNPHYAEPYYGRALVKLTLEDENGAINDLTAAIKNSIPLQAIHNKARKLKSELLLNKGAYDKAETDLRFLALRKYDESDPFYKHVPQIIYDYGNALIALEKNVEAIAIFEKLMTSENLTKKIDKGELLCRYGTALHRAGKKGFKKNWKSAAELGSKEAADLLSNYK